MSKVLVLRTCNADLTSKNNFQWPSEGHVSCPDWNPDPLWGGGLHGALWGEGDGSLFNWEPDAKWLVVEVDQDKIIDLKGKVKFPEGVVVHCGDQKSATDYILKHGAVGRAVIGAMISVGDRGTAMAGDYGTAVAGDYGTAMAGYNGTAMAGYNGTATAGYGGTATAGNDGIATAGNGGTATAGDCGKALAGHRGLAIAGFRGSARAGYCGTAIVEHPGQAAAGDGGTIKIEYWDEIEKKFKIKRGKIGEGGLKPGVSYQLNKDLEFVEADFQE